MANQEKSVVTFVGVGDVSPNRPDPPSLFKYTREVFHGADIAFGQMESPLSDRGTPAFVPGAPCRLPAKGISALTEEGAGFDVMSHACNHAMDYCWEAFFDTLNALKSHNIAVVGAGANIAEARKPAILERKGVRVGILAYLSIVTPGVVAEEDVPGCAPLRASHFYQQFDFQPGTPPLILTRLFPEDRAAMEADIKSLRPLVDVVIVSMHCGIHFVPAVVAMYQKEAAYAAIDAGADLILQHHAHVCKGIEVYKDKAIFYGLGNFALEHSQPFEGQLRAWEPNYRKLRDFYHIKPIPGWEKYKYLPDARSTMIAKAYIEDKKIKKVTYIPCYVRPTLEPELVTRPDPRAQGVFDYIKQISESEELKVKFAWDGDEVLISSQ